MFNIKIDATHNINNAGGIQEKFFYNNEYYKIDKAGAEGIAEELSSQVLICSNLKPDEYVIYEYGTINSQKGCKSANFLTGKEKFINFNTLHNTFFDIRLDYYMRNFSMKEKINYTINFLKETTNIDITDYLRKCITLDYIIKNTDRHFSNLGIIQCEDDSFRPAPIFDNGQSLMSNMSLIRIKTIEENLEELKAKPFNDDINQMYEYFGPGFKVNFKHLKEILDSYNIKDGEYGYEQLVILKHQANKFLNSELNFENGLEEKIEIFKDISYKIENRKLILNEAAQRECDALIEKGVIANKNQYPAFKDTQR